MPTLNATIFEGGVDILPDQNNVNIGTGGGALTGAWFSLRNADRAYLKVRVPPGSATDHIVVAPLQAKDSSGTGSKALTVSRVWSKVGTTSVSSDNAVAQWTMTELTTPSSSVSSGSITGQQYTSNGNAGTAVTTQNLGADTKAATLIFEVRRPSLDINNGFCFVSFGITQLATAASRIVSTEVVLSGDSYPQNIPISKIS